MAKHKPYRWYWLDILCAFILAATAGAFILGSLAFTLLFLALEASWKTCVAVALFYGFVTWRAGKAARHGEI